LVRSPKRTAPALSFVSDHRIETGDVSELTAYVLVLATQTVVGPEINTAAAEGNAALSNRQNIKQVVFCKT
jgi:hypothetical protein